MSSRVTLFSTYSPDLGGGGTNLRSLVPELGPVTVDWMYTGHRDSTFPGSRRVAPPMAGGGPWHDLSRLLALWSGLTTRTFQRVMDALTADGSSRFWVVGHNEGVLVAEALASRGARVHLTIQDDLPDGIFRRSRRYRFLAPWIRRRYERTLRRVASVDVTSDGMQRYYRDRLGLQSVVVHPFVAALPTGPAKSTVSGELSVGHIGSIYATSEWRAFLRGLQHAARSRGVRARMIAIGLAPRFRPVAQEFGDLVEIVADLPEDEAVDRLSACDFLYAMYPFDEGSEVFRRTSLPTKVTSYIKCRRPIFAHALPASTLVETVDRFGLGMPCDSVDENRVAAAIHELMDRPPPRDAYERARRELYGIENVERLRACLEAL